MKKTTKVMTMLLCAVTMVVLSACSKEDTYQRRIIGKWECVHFKHLPDNPANVDPNQYDDYTNSGNIGLIWEFSSDGIVKETATYGTNAFTYSITEEYLVCAGIASFNIHELTNSSLIVWWNGSGNYCRYYEFQRVR